MNYKSYFPRGKRVAKFIDGKGVPAPPKRNEVFQKKSIEKAGFYFQKFEKYLKSKNDLKMLLGAFNQEL